MCADRTAGNPLTDYEGSCVQSGNRLPGADWVLVLPDSNPGCRRGRFLDCEYLAKGFPNREGVDAQDSRYPVPSKTGRSLGGSEVHPGVDLRSAWLLTTD